MRLDHICNTMGKAPMYGLTITNNIKTNYVQSGKEIFKFQRFEYKGVTVKPKKIKYEKVERPEIDLSDDSDSSVSSSSSKSNQVRVNDEKLNGDIGEPNSDLKPKRKGESANVLQSFSQLDVGGIQVTTDAPATIN